MRNAYEPKRRTIGAGANLLDGGEKGHFVVPQKHALTDISGAAMQSFFWKLSSVQEQVASLAQRRIPNRPRAAARPRPERFLMTRNGQSRQRMKPKEQKR